MPFATADLDAWVDSLGLPDDRKKAVRDALADEKVLPKVGETVLARAEFSRKMDELANKAKQLEKDYNAKRAAEDKFHDDLANWKTGSEKELADAKKASEAARQRLASVRQSIQALGAEYGVPED